MQEQLSDKYLKSSLDRFIAIYFAHKFTPLLDLKSSLDRFIEVVDVLLFDSVLYLKSSLDRFIVLAIYSHPVISRI